MDCVLTTLYNVVLDPELAKRFRIAITQRLFDYFLRKDDIGIRCLIKFSISCIHMLLSRSELSQVCIELVEANLLARCLNGVDSFFGGYDSLMTTIENLACNPKHQQIFVDCGIVSILKSTVLNRALNVDRRIFRTFLHLIPEPDTSLQQLEEEFVFPLHNSVTEMLTSDPLFMDLLRKSDEDLCKGLLLLLFPSDVATSGIVIVLQYFSERLKQGSWKRRIQSDTDADTDTNIFKIHLHCTNSYFFIPKVVFTAAFASRPRC